ncbi:hypothetical protein X733_33540 [Mesorhizobium sp. L2C067A000]|nr:hypothetical protein X733_33540 [Mesorhizobium sp. L2C067A000]
MSEHRGRRREQTLLPREVDKIIEQGIADIYMTRKNALPRSSPWIFGASTVALNLPVPSRKAVLPRLEQAP